MEKPRNREEVIRVLTERTPKSGKLWKEAQGSVPGGLISAARKFKPYPFYTERGKGAYIWDIDGNRYIDCANAFGPALLGHAHPVPEKAIIEQLGKGTIYGTPHTLDIEYSKLLTECIPCADNILVCNSGTEATMQGIRIMRAYSGKKKIAKFEGGYHGWHDYAQWSVSLDPEKMGEESKPNMNPESAGIPDEIKDLMMVLPFTEDAFEIIAENADELAGVMIEPAIGTYALSVDKEFLAKLREVTTENNVLLMFDEVITGFRLALGGGQEYFGITPDLATYGKVIGGGLPVGAVGVKKELMDTVLQGDTSIAIAGTFSGNPMTLAGGLAEVNFLKENQHLYKETEARGDRLRAGFNEWASANGYPATMTGISSLFQVHLKQPPVTKPREMLGQPEEALLDLQLILRYYGLFIPWIHVALLSFAHTDELVDEILEIFKLSTETALEFNGLI